MDSMTSSQNSASRQSGFSEKDFYLNEFRGRTLAIAIPARCIRHVGVLVSVIEELTKNGVRVVVISDSQQKIFGVFESMLFSDEENLLSKVWRRLSQKP